jgi:hypothetical protein
MIVFEYLIYNIDKIVNDKEIQNKKKEVHENC